MKLKYFIFSLFIGFSFYANSQVVEGKIAIYDKAAYDMGEEDGWARIRANGGMAFTRKGYISFKDNSILFVIGSSDGYSEVYNSYGFEYPDMKKNTIIPGSGIIHDEFFLKDSENLQVNLSYYPGKYMSDGKDLFILTHYKNSFMYFLKPYKDESEKIKAVYSEN